MKPPAAPIPLAGFQFGDVRHVCALAGADRPPLPSRISAATNGDLRTPSSRGGQSVYSLSNSSVDVQGAMHLPITKTEAIWSCAEASLTRNLGFGTYEFGVG